VLGPPIRGIAPGDVHHCDTLEGDLQMRDFWEILANPRVWGLLLLSFLIGEILAESVGPWFDQQLRASAEASQEEDQLTQ